MLASAVNKVDDDENDTHTWYKRAAEKVSVISEEVSSLFKIREKEIDNEMNPERPNRGVTKLRHSNGIDDEDDDAAAADAKKE